MRSRRFTRWMVKDAFDNLPGGVCFFGRKGLLVLCNHTMHRLAFMLTGRDLQSLGELTDALETLPPQATAVKDGEVYLMPDKSAWRFTSDTVSDSRGNRYTQVTAADVTELYRARLELEENNRRLAEHGRRLRELSANIGAVTCEEEILSMKMRVHDEIGRSVIAARQLLQQGRPTAELDMAAWQNALRLLKNDSENAQDKNALEQLTEAASGIGIRLILDGQMPDNEAAAYLLITAMRECATNAVRHAGASELYAEVTCENDAASVTLTDNGRPPEGTITEGGGLSSLRARIEKAGGSMSIVSAPAFSLTVTVPLPKEEIQ